MQYEYVDDSSSQFVIQRSDYPREIPTFQYLGEEARLVNSVNSFPDTDRTLTRLFLRVIFLDYLCYNMPFPDCFMAIDPIFYLYLQNQYKRSTE
ncbi:hypothetical protein ACTXT7_003979 [Hymenolepis weldensis]